MLRPLLLTAFAACAPFLLVACSGTQAATLYDPYLDLSVESTGKLDGGIIDGNTSAFVSDINANCAITGLELRTGASLGEDGKLAAGPSEVLEIDFISKGDWNVTTLDEREIRLALELDQDGNITRGYFGGKGTGIAAIARSFPTDTFLKGKVWFLMRDREFRVGQIDAHFHGHRISGNFRVLVRGMK